MRKPFERLPESVFVEGNYYKVNTDFRIWAELCDFLESEADYEEKILRLLCCGYTKELPPHLDTAVYALFNFMALGKKGRGSLGEPHERVMDFSSDEGLIYAGFMEQYGIDLYKESIHWWSFMNLLNGLSENTAFMRVVGYRSMDCSKIKNKEMKSFYRKMKNRYRLSECVGDDKIALALEGIM